MATWDDATGVPSRIFGAGAPAPKSVSSAKAAEHYAQRLLEQHIDLLAPGASPKDFVMVTNEVVDGQRVVAFLQHAAGMRVLGGQLSFRFKNDRLFVIASGALPAVSVRAPTHMVSEATAQQSARGWIEQDFGAVSTMGPAEGPLVLPLLGTGSVHGYEVAWRVEVTTAAPIGRWWVYVDAAKGAVIAREQTLSFATGTVMYNVPVRRPTDARADYPARYADLVVGGNPVTADAAGLVTFLDGPPVSVDTGAAGPRVRVLNDMGAEATTTLSLAPSASVTWDASSTAEVDAQLAAFIHVQIAKDTAWALNPVFANWLGQQITANVNINDQCNAFYDGTTVNFYRQSNNCENTGRLADVVYHEFGHAFHHRSVLLGSGEFDSALSEGLSDYYAANITGDPGMGRGFFYSNQPLRHIDPSISEKVWPDDVSSDPHQTGLIIAGALWDLRKLLVTKLGDPAGVDKTNELYSTSIKNAMDIPSMYVEVLAADDDDGNIENGTPNACEIAQAFGVHGLRPIQVVGSDLDVQAPELTGYRVSVKVEGLFGSCPSDTVDGATVEWKLRDGDGVSATIPMTGGPTEFTAEIPKAAEGQVVNYKVQVSLGTGGDLSFPDNAADPMYEFFVGQVTPVYCTDFEIDPATEGWTHGLLSGMTSEGADDWQWGAPAGTASSGDPAAAFSGSMIFGNDLGLGNFNGRYQRDITNYADSPVVDVSAVDNARLQYRRWLQVEDGFFDQARIYVNGQLAWDNFASPSQSGTTNHTDREWRFHDVDLTKFMSSQGTVQVRFELDSDDGVQMGGWSLDDFCIVTFERTAPPPAVCGNGAVELGEGCDDANTSAGDGCDSACQAEQVNGEGPDPLQVGGGCGCEAVGARGTPRWLLGLAALGAASVLGRRRRQ